MDFLQILEEQKAERDALPLASYCPRAQQSRIELGSPLAQVIIGMRRSGKTTLCHQALQASGCSYAYINFDDETLANLPLAQCNDLLKAAYVVYGEFTHLFLDEIQNVAGWELFVNRLLRQGLHLVLTGSNSHLLSQELGTHLTGRYKEIELLPLSFREYLAFRHLPADARTTRDQARLLDAYREYSTRGGLPESHSVADWRSYIKTLYNAILFKDVVRRYNVRYPKVLGSIASVLLGNFCREVNYTEIGRLLGVKGTHTLQNYADYLEKAYLVHLLPKFSYRPLLRAQSEKAYALDMGIASAFSGVSSAAENLGWRMENLVFLKLYGEREKGNYELYYWKDGCEIDFVLARGQRVLQLVQVAYDLSADRTRHHEIHALQKASAQLSCDNLHIVTLTEEVRLEQDGKTIQLHSIPQFLLQPVDIAP